MKWKSVISLSAILLLFSISLVMHAQANPAFHEITITVAAGSTRVPAGTPVIIKISDIEAKLAGANIDWKSIYLFSGSSISDPFSIVPYQIDDIDGVAGITANDEFVFQTAAEIAASGTAPYTMWFAEVADDFQSFSWPTFAWIDVAQNYSNTDLGALGGPYRAEFGLGRPTYFLKNDMSTIAVPLQPDYRQGGAFNAVINASAFDIVKQGSYLTRKELGFRWSSYIYESDPGWVNTPTNFTVVKTIMGGPVRSMLVINSTAPYADGGLHPGVHELKTYISYNGMPAVYSNIALTGANATQNQSYNFTYHVKMVDFPQSGAIYDTVYGPGVGTMPRYNYAIHRGQQGTLYDFSLGLTSLSKWWFKMYNATSQQGYGLAFSNASLLKIDWSTDDELDLTYNNLPSEGAQRLLVMFDPTVTSNSTTLMTNMYDTWKAAPTTTLTTAIAAPGGESPDVNLITLQSEIAASKLQEDILQSRIARLGFDIGMLNLMLSTLQTTLNDQAIMLDDLNSTITTLSNTITSLQTTINSQASSINTLTTSVNALKSNNTALTTTTNDLKDKVDSANATAASATTYGIVGIVVGIIGIIVGAVAYMRKK